MVDFNRLIGHKRLQASMYGGQAAAGFASGFMQGSEFMDKSKAAKEESEVRQLKMEKIKSENELYQVAVDNAMGKEQSQEALEVQELKKTVQEQGQAIKKQNGSVVAQDINNLTTMNTTANRDKSIQTWKAKIKANPNAYKALGVSPKSDISVVSIDNSQHKAELTRYLEIQGVSAQEFGINTTTPEGKEAWNKQLRQYADKVPAVMIDGKYVDLVGLGVGIGSSNQMTPEQRHSIDENLLDLGDMGVANRVTAERPEQPVEVAGQEFDANDPAAGDKQMAARDAMPEPVPGVASEPRPAGEIQGAEKSIEMEIADNLWTYDPNTGYLDMSPEAIKAREAANPTSTPGVVKNYKDFLGKIDRHETSASSDRYTQKNPTSSAYGRGQVINDTNTSMARKMGITPEQARTKEGQDIVLKGLYEEYTATLKVNDLPPTEANYYALHQLGGPTGTKYIKGNIDGKVIAGMRNQYGAKTNSKLSDEQVVKKWTQQFGSNEDGTTANTATASQEVAAIAVSDKAATGPDMAKVYALLGKTYPYGTDGDAHKTAKIRNYKFLISEGLDKDSAYKATFGESGTKVSRKQAGYKQAVEENVGYDSKVANGIPLTVEEQVLYDANLEIAEDFEDSAGIQGKRYDKTAMTKGRDSAQSALKILGKHAGDEDAIEDLQDAQFSMRQANGEAFKLEGKDIQTIKELQVTSNQTADVINRVNHGDLQEMDRDMIESVKQTAATMLPAGMEENLPADWKETMIANTKKDASLGLLQAQFIKAISGATVTDKERANLVKTMVGGDGWNNRATMMTALTEFYHMNNDKVGMIGDQLKTGVSPYDGHRYSQITPLGETHVPERGKVKETKTVTRTGKLADGRTVTQYSDGTQEIK